jgi:acyl-CoA synthetase (AMP-forming)/AMP-acid ligase II
MDLTDVLDLVVEGHRHREILTASGTHVDAAQLRAAAYQGSREVRASGAEIVVFLGENGVAFPLALFAAAGAGVPLLPLNYRLAPDALREIIGRYEKALVVSDSDTFDGLPGITRRLRCDAWIAACAATQSAASPPVRPGGDAVAVVLMTSGTTAAPKAAVLRHKNLVSYLLDTVEFGASDSSEAMLVSVPPYHVAAIANLLSNLYRGRRVVYAGRFSAPAWLDTAECQGVTHAMLVPTMLARVVEELESGRRMAPPQLRSLSYGGAKIAPLLLQRALKLLPEVGFVNGYGLTETSSSIAALSPDDHREALASADPAVRARLGSVGRPLPSVEIEIRLPGGELAPPGTVGLIYVRGAQVSGEYQGAEALLDEEGWFCTRDEGHLDKDGFLFVRGRTDDTIIRGGENIAPAEIEAVLHEHPGIAEAAVIGIPDVEWGQRIAAFLVTRVDIDADDVRAFVRARLRSSKTPDDIYFLDELPHNPTGKLLRRELGEMIPRLVGGIGGWPPQAPADASSRLRSACPGSGQRRAATGNERKEGEICRSLERMRRGAHARRARRARAGVSSTMTGTGNRSSSCTRASPPSSRYPRPATLTSRSGSMSGPRSTGPRNQANCQRSPRWSFPATRAAATGSPR